MLKKQHSQYESPRLGALMPDFLRYAQVELQFAPQSIVKYRDCLRQVGRIVGDRPVAAYSENDVLILKSRMLDKGHSVNRQISILSALKRFLQYCRERRDLPVFDPQKIVVPRRPRREVSYLTADEVERFITVIPLETVQGSNRMQGLRFRALVEALLGSAMRIGELLSLDRSQIDFQNREARIVGKGNKQRTVFFSERAVLWIQRYLQLRQDEHPALFVTQNGRSRVGRDDVWRPFSRYRQRAGINKPVTPHILRHTAATHLLFNGCPVGHIKEILGHERLETTCRYYLGLDHRAAKQAHQRFLVYSRSHDSAGPLRHP